MGLEPAFWAALFGVDEAVAVRESSLIRDVVAVDRDAWLEIEWRIGCGRPRWQQHCHEFNRETGEL